MSCLPYCPETLIAVIKNLFIRDLALQNDYLRQENKILRGKLGKRGPLSDHGRRLLVRYGMRIKDHLPEIISIVKPETLLAWHRRMKRCKWTFGHKNPTGRPRKAESTEKLLVRLAEDNAWGYCRIAGEMKKLGHDLCAGAVRNILIKNGLPPSPRRKGMSWKQFIQSHLDVTWAMDFFTEEIWTMAGMVLFTPFFSFTCKAAGCISPAARRIPILSGSSSRRVISLC